MSRHDDAPTPRPLHRREFFQLGLLGAVGASTSLAACSASAQVPPVPEAGLTAAQLRAAAESWNEPWIWRPGDWPGQPLQLNVVENQSAGAVIGFGNPNRVLFSYGGQTPGPTIRMKGDETLAVRLQNLLGFDGGLTAIGPNPDPATLTPEQDRQVFILVNGREPTPGELASFNAKDYPRAITELIGNTVRPDYCLGEHTNGLHSAHVTNLHTHGLHVRPYRNPDGTHSDNVILRVLPQADFRRREAAARAAECEFLRQPEQTNVLREDEQVGVANYEFRLGDVQRDHRAPGAPPQPHPPGTHWYHPHSHGATHNQVASGMAGFLIVEGDVDERINERMTDRPDPDPTLKTGPWDYRERLMLVQRVFLPPADPDAPQQRQKQQTNAAPLVNGNPEPALITMRPGAVERWRMLNGSVDGRGFKRMMVLEGLYGLVDVAKPDGSGTVPKLAKADTSGRLRRASYAQIEADKQDLALLALDGITLVTEDGDYTIRDLSAQRAGTANPLAGPEATNRDLLDNFEAVFRDGESIRNTWVRPNEVYFGPANRADVLFKAPPGAPEGAIYTVVAKAVVVHADNYQQKLQVNRDKRQLVPGPQDIVVAHIVVKGAACEPFDVLSLRDVLPPAPPYLQPIAPDELAVDAGGGFRTRTVTYSGWGSQDYPLVTTADDDPSAPAFRAFIEAHPELRGLVYDTHDGVDVLIPAAIRTMAIDGRKFDPMDPERPKMLAESAEEWALYNVSTMLWGDVEAGTTGQYKGHHRSYPLSRADGQARNRRAASFQTVTKGVDHPFHMHQNPFWVMRIEIPDETGRLHNILDAPRWQDAVWIPRHQGRVVFRSRFPDFVGTYVHHCHLLQHEDNGMMTVVEVTPFEDQSNETTRTRVATTAMGPAEVDEIYPRPSREDAYRASAAFVDPNMNTGQVYPGFEVTPPSLP